MPNNRLKLLAALVAILLIGIAGFWFVNKDDSSNESSQNPTGQPASSTNQPTGFDKAQFSLDEPSSLWVVVNKRRPLPASFTPSDLTNANGAMLRNESAQAVKQLIDKAAADGVKLKVISGFRSYATQKSVYDSYVQQDGQTAADTYSARPGYSEHQTGLAADLGNTDGRCDLDICFADTAGGKWLADHAAEFGFVIRYEQGKTDLTGYQYEPWHIRYVGKALAAELQKSGQTMEEFFGLEPAVNY